MLTAKQIQLAEHLAPHISSDTAIHKEVETSAWQVRFCRAVPRDEGGAQVTGLPLLDWETLQWWDTTLARLAARKLLRADKSAAARKGWNTRRAG